MHSHLYLYDVALVIHPPHITDCCDDDRYVADHVLEEASCVRIVYRDDARYVADHVLEEVSCVKFGADEYNHAL